YRGLGTCSVFLYDIPTRRLIQELKFPSSRTDTRQTGVWALAFSPDGRWLVAGIRNGEMHFWDTSRPEMPRLAQHPHRAEVTGLVFRPDGKVLVSCSEDDTLRIW